MTRPHALWVYAHPAQDALNRSLRKDAIATLSTQYDVTVVDLYEQRWSPVLHDDLTASGPTLGARLRQKQAAGCAPPDVAVQQELLSRAALLVVQFPLWWYSPPAIFKGWIDRVFANGFAFGVKDDAGATMKYGRGGLQGKRALTVVTAGDRATAFTAMGINGHIEWLLFPLLHGTFWYTGMEPLRPHLIAGVDRPGWNEFDAEKKRLVRRLAMVAKEDPIPYRSLASGDYGADRTLVCPPETVGLDAHLDRSRCLSASFAANESASRLRFTG